MQIYAYKCDRCGKEYRLGEGKNKYDNFDYEIRNTLKSDDLNYMIDKERLKRLKGFAGHRLDLCPECYAELCSWLEKKQMSKWRDPQKENPPVGRVLVHVYIMPVVSLEDGNIHTEGSASEYVCEAIYDGESYRFEQNGKNYVVDGASGCGLAVCQTDTGMDGFRCADVVEWAPSPQFQPVKAQYTVEGIGFTKKEYVDFFTNLLAAQTK